MCILLAGNTNYVSPRRSGSSSGGIILTSSPRSSRASAGSAKASVTQPVVEPVASTAPPPPIASLPALRAMLAPPISSSSGAEPTATNQQLALSLARSAPISMSGNQLEDASRTLLSAPSTSLIPPHTAAAVTLPTKPISPIPATTHGHNSDRIRQHLLSSSSIAGSSSLQFHNFPSQSQPIMYPATSFNNYNIDTAAAASTAASPITSLDGAILLTAAETADAQAKVAAAKRRAAAGVVGKKLTGGVAGGIVGSSSTDSKDDKPLPSFPLFLPPG